MARDGDSEANLPLKSVVLCCTSLSQDVRTNLSDTAKQMGAIHKLDLTSDVTHLIVGSITTPKYRYVAKERPDIKVLRTEWIDVVRESWMEGGDVDIESLEKTHAIPTFFELKICVTGFGDLEQRDRISETILKQGGQYHGDLTRDVTHLIAAAPHGAKYTHAKQWGISVVSLRWFEDSLLRGMALDESLYLPELPAEQQGIGAFRTERKPRTSLGKREREESERIAANEEFGKRKLRKVASMRLEGHSQDLWQNMSASEIQAATSGVDVWKDEGGRREDKPHEDQDACKSEGPISIKETMIQRPEQQQNLFAGYYILLHGFERDRKARLRQFLEPNGAQVVDSAEELETASSNAFFKSRCVITPHAEPSCSREMLNLPPGTIQGTEWWVERCIHYKQVLDPEEDILSRPLGDVTIREYADLKISTTGFIGVDLRQTAEAVTLMGATYLEKLLPSTSVLVSGSDTVKKEKAFYAFKHSVPVVSMHWLSACLKSRRKLPFKEYLIKLPSFDLKEFSGKSPADTSSLNASFQGNPGEDTKSVEQRSKRLSNTRRRHATPSLTLKASKSSLSRSGPFIHEDEDEPPQSIDERPSSRLRDSAVSPRPSPALRNISPNASPQKTEHGFPKSKFAELDDGDQFSVPSGDANDESASRLEPPASPQESPETLQIDHQQQTPRLHEQLTADLASILARQIARGPESADVPSPQKRKNRPLGRNLSGISQHRSTPNSAQGGTNSPVSLLPPGDAPHGESNSTADGFSFSRRSGKEVEPPPSTQLGYETAEAQAHRRQMSMKMGTVFQDEHSGTRVASLGTVKDSELISQKGVFNRVKGRQRNR